jgi:phenylpropionate dioxygenase-like ring-hydroxylating dioxygenase large terminal subunit
MKTGSIRVTHARSIFQKKICVLPPLSTTVRLQSHTPDPSLPPSHESWIVLFHDHDPLFSVRIITYYLISKWRTKSWWFEGELNGHVRDRFWLSQDLNVRRLNSSTNSVFYPNKTDILQMRNTLQSHHLGHFNYFPKAHYMFSTCNFILEKNMNIYPLQISVYRCLETTKN